MSVTHSLSVESAALLRTTVPAASGIHCDFELYRGKGQMGEGMRETKVHYT